MINLHVSIMHDHHSPGDAAIRNAEVVPILKDIQDYCDEKYDDDHDDLVDQNVDKTDKK